MSPAPSDSPRRPDVRLDQVVVGIKHADLVSAELSTLSAPPTSIDYDAALGLALLSFEAREAARRVPANHARPTEPTASDLDAVMRHLRSTFASRYAGWMPSMGKNRAVKRDPGSFVVSDGSGGQVDPLHAVDYGADTHGTHAVDYGADTHGTHAVDYGADAHGTHAVHYGADTHGTHAVDYGADTHGTHAVDYGADTHGTHAVDYGADAHGTHAVDYGGRFGPKPVRDPIGSPAPRRGDHGTGVTIGVVDTSLHAHPWLAGGYLAPADAIRMPRSGAAWTSHHGTFVTGLVLANAPAARVEFRATLDDDATADSWDVAKAIVALGLTTDIEIINLSLGCITEDADPPLVLQAAVAALAGRCLVVAAAGNHGNAASEAIPAPSFPAAFDSVVAIGADDNGRAARFSVRAPWVDAVAPGVDVVSTVVAGAPTFGRWSGSSFSSAIAAGVIAAAMTDGRSAFDAWDELRQTDRRDADGLPRITAAGPSDWPRR